MKKMSTVLIFKKELFSNMFFWLDNFIMFVTVFLYFLSFALGNQPLIFICLALFFVSALVHFFIISFLKKKLLSCPGTTIIIWQSIFYLFLFFVLAIIFRCLGFPLFYDFIDFLISLFFVFYSVAFFLIDYIFLKEKKVN